MIVGFTGTRDSLPEDQEQRLYATLWELSISEFHHGDCVGADAIAHDIVREMFPAAKIHIHPPTDSTRRAFRIGDVEHPELPFLDRNMKIVRSASSGCMVACPNSESNVLRSGTWSTIRFATKNGIPVIKVLP